jgi:hypothetical protein
VIDHAGISLVILSRVQTREERKQRRGRQPRLRIP